MKERRVLRKAKRAERRKESTAELRQGESILMAWNGNGQRPEKCDLMSFRQKLLVGYLPYTTAAILIVFLLIGSSRSWSAVLAGGVIFLAWSFGLLLCQLVIFRLPGRNNDRSVFHASCITATFVNLFVAPVVIALLVWVVGRLVT